MMRAGLVMLLLMAGLWGAWQPSAADGLFLTIREFDPRGQTFGPPPAGENSVLLAPGQSYGLPCAAAQQGSGVLCGPQLAIDVPAGSSGLTFQAEAEAEFVVFLRFGAEVELDNGRPISDFAAQSSGGQFNFFIPTFQPGDQFPGLQEGRYYFAIAHFETSEQRYAVSGGATRIKPLSVQVPVSLTCTAFEILCVQQFSVRVSDEGQLQLSVRGTAGFVVHVRFQTPVELPPLTFNEQGLGQVGNPISDASARSNGGQATVQLDAATTPALRSGTYYVALVNLVDADQELTLTASFGQAQRQPPHADFSFAPAQPRIGQPVSFSDTSSDPAGQIVAWSWDFGDGATSPEQNPSHSYSLAGTYRVALLVSNDADLSTVAAHSLTVLPAPAGPLLAIAFSQLTFADPAAWQREVQQGCVVYTNASQQEAFVELQTLDGQVQSHSVPSHGTVLVCGNVAHFQ